MSDNSSIQWTSASWTPLRARDPRDGKTGWHCVRISPACQHCYASTFNGRRLPNGGTGLDYVATSPAESYLDEEVLTQPLRWKKPRKIFVCSMTDLFGDWVRDEWIDRVFAIIARCRQHTFQVLTKRADRMADYLTTRTRQGRVNDASIVHHNYGIWLKLGIGSDSEEISGPAWPLEHVHIGFSAENQEWFDKRAVQMAPLMRAGWFVWVSAEPLLGHIRMQGWDGVLQRNWLCEQGIRWTVIGGESGAGARECKMEWIRSLVKQCKDANVPVFVKQLGKRPTGDWGPSPPTYTLTEVRRGCQHTTTELSQYKNGIWKLRDKKGGFIGEFPEDLKIREFPEVSHAR